MNIVRENIDALNAVVKIKLSPEDYEGKVEDRLRDMRKNAKIPGFRPGHVPIGMIRKMAGTGTLIEEINKLLSRSINDYISDNQIKILGNPLPKQDEKKSIDWDKQKDFEFEFELGLAPEVEMSVLDKVKVEKYAIEVDDKVIDSQVKDLRRRFGKMSETNTVSEDDFVVGNFEEVDKNGEVIENGISHSSAMLVSGIENKKVKKALIDLTAGQSIIIKYDQFDSDEEKSRHLGRKKEELIFNKSSFRFTIGKIQHIEETEISQEFFDKVFGAAVVTNETEFRLKVAEDLKKQFSLNSDQRLFYDIQERIIEKSKIALPDNFLKKWLENSNEKSITKEQIEAEYDLYARSLKWQIIENMIIREKKLEVSKEEAELYTVELLKKQFATYGQPLPAEEELRETAHGLLHKSEEARRVYDQIYDKKLMEMFKNDLNLKEKKISYDDFIKLARK